MSVQYDVSAVVAAEHPRTHRGAGRVGRGIHVHDQAESFCLLLPGGGGNIGAEDAGAFVQAHVAGTDADEFVLQQMRQVALASRRGHFAAQRVGLGVDLGVTNEPVADRLIKHCACHAQ